jgi:hypothetical protein
MSRRCALGTVLVALAGVLLLAASASAADQTPRVSVATDREQISTKLGGKFTFRTTIANRGSTAVSGLIAHLNVLSLRDGVYVDPEDWSPRRTVYLDTISAGGSVTTTWRMQAVNDGSFGVYVAVLPSSGVARAPTTGPTIHLAVEERKTLNAGGILPLALGIPALLGVLTLALMVHTRRRGGQSLTPLPLR